MSKKVGIIALAMLLVVCAGALSFANEGLFAGPEVNERDDEDNGDTRPPEWAPEHARERWEWSQDEDRDEGPPPWAPEHARERWEWSQDEDRDEGPPPWAPGPPDWVPGPPPWARGKDNGNQ